MGRVVQIEDELGLMIEAERNSSAAVDEKLLQHALIVRAREELGATRRATFHEGAQHRVQHDFEARRAAI